MQGVEDCDDDQYSAARPDNPNDLVKRLVFLLVRHNRVSGEAAKSVRKE